jgi:hypothetical protein
MRRHFVLVASCALLTACSASSNGDGGGNPLGTDSSVGNGDTGNGGDDASDYDGADYDAGFGIDATPDIGADAFYVNDPPVKSCGDAGVTLPPPPGGTPDCPDDKNLPGCPCGPTAKVGDTAPCWTGYRRNRSRGVCKDGQTTCVKKGEVNLVWSDCSGEQLPTGTTGKEACTCFSGGEWALANTSPCFITDSSTGKIVNAVSTYLDSSGKMQCAVDSAGKFVSTSPNWSTTTLKTDCAGHFKLCYAIKAGDPNNPQPTDCTVMQVCTEGDYKTPNTVQPFGSLGAWQTGDVACASKFATTGQGYGEMSVLGTSVECDSVGKVFQRFKYCPLSCNTNPSAPECAGCTTGGSGGF